MTQTFYEYMAQFLRDRNVKNVVEIGSDVQLKLALNLAPHCRTFYSINFPEDHARMQGWYELHQDMGGVTNIKLLSGNAVQLSDLIKHTDIIILQNVLIDGTGTDADLTWKYRRGELKCSNEQWVELCGRFRQAEENAYREFLRVAKPGHIVRFGRPEEDGRFKSMLVDKLGVEPTRIQTRQLLYDETRDVWETYFIDNS